MKIAMTSLPVIDPIKAYKFYTDILGFKEKMFVPDANIAIVVSAEDPEGTSLLLEPRGNLKSDEYFGGIYEAGLPIIVFGVADVEAEYQALKSRGVVFKKAPTKTEWGVEAIFDDTCGNLIQIAQLN